MQISFKLLNVDLPKKLFDAHVPLIKKLTYILQGPLVVS